MAARSSRAGVRMKTRRGVEAFITVRLGILTKPGMQKSEAEKFSCCLNLGTMLLRSLQFPKHSEHHSSGGEADREDTWKVQGPLFPLIVSHARLPAGTPCSEMRGEA